MDDKLQVAITDIASSLGAVVGLLMAKGVITEDEFVMTKTQVGAALDQEIAKAREAFLKENPGFRLMEALAGGGDVKAVLEEIAKSKDAK